MNISIIRLGISISLVFFACFFIEESEALVPQCVKNAAEATYSDTKKLLSQRVEHPFYFGGGLGYGNTNWSEITTTPSSSTASNPGGNPVAEAAPISANSSVFASDAFIGYQFSPHFMLEGDYTHFNSTQVNFQTTQEAFGSVVPFFNDYGISQLNTGTNAYTLLGKILVPLGFLTRVYVYADAGVSYVQRVDYSMEKLDYYSTAYSPFELSDIGHFGPSFGFGFHYDFMPHLFTEASFQYTTGYGTANAQPAQNYIPFIYSLMFNLGIRV